MEEREILEKVKSGDISIESALRELKTKPFKDIDFAKIDLQRKLRTGAGEVIYGSGKTPNQIIKIIDTMLENGQKNILITRLSKESAEKIKDRFELKYFEDAKVAIFGEFMKASGLGKIVVATGGTSDIPVAEEAALTAEFLGNEVIRLYDVGVAGLHRLLAHIDELTDASVIIAIAGMEGALASVIGGLVEAPVIAVPTSVGYGASLNGVAALLSMLNSCASGVSVVNIDNGFGVGFLANRINHMEEKKWKHFI